MSAGGTGVSGGWSDHSTQRLGRIRWTQAEIPRVEKKANWKTQHDRATPTFCSKKEREVDENMRRKRNSQLEKWSFHPFLRGKKLTRVRDDDGAGSFQLVQRGRHFARSVLYRGVVVFR